ncbi:hypothetical protein BH10PAT1_BH10PAT1_0960 [soil metagenome]
MGSCRSGQRSKFMKKILSNLIFIYSALVCLFIIISTAMASSSIPIAFIILFLPVFLYFLFELFKRDPESKVFPREGEMVFILIVFTILFGIGLRNVLIAPHKKINNTSPSENLVFKTQKQTTPTPSPSPTPVAEIVTVNISDGSNSINIREKPTIYSDKVGEAKDGDQFSKISETTEWDEVQKDNVHGYISKIYIKK